MKLLAEGFEACLEELEDPRIDTIGRSCTPAARDFVRGALWGAVWGAQLARFGGVCAHEVAYVQRAL
jgi:hypothetical protein